MPTVKSIAIAIGTFPKSASNEFPFESLSSGYSDVSNVKETRMQFPDFLGFRPPRFL